MPRRTVDEIFAALAEHNRSVNDALPQQTAEERRAFLDKFDAAIEAQEADEEGDEESEDKDWSVDEDGEVA